MQSKVRLRFVDGLRGVAAMLVVAYHFWENLPTASRDATPRFVAWFLEHGNLGVDIFFVLSGFVIAHSIRNADLSLSYVGRFAVRRSIRLDPPFWLTIATEVFLVHLGIAFFPSLGTPVPAWGAVLANASYSYRFLGQPEILPIFWSLTYEVQFYLVLILGAVAVRRMARIPAINALTRGFFVAAFAYSLLIWLDLLPLPLQGLFIDRWYQFALGVAAWFIAVPREHPRSFIALSLAGVVGAVAFFPSEYRLLATLVTCGTAGALAYAGRQGKMDWLSGRTLQFLGRISYSVYLLHVPIGWRTMSLLKRLWGPDMGAVAGYAVFALAVALSILSAWAMFLLVERPAMQLARRITLRSRAPIGALETAAA